MGSYKRFASKNSEETYTDTIVKVPYFLVNYIILQIIISVFES